MLVTLPMMLPHLLALKAAAIRRIVAESALPEQRPSTVAVSSSWNSVTVTLSYSPTVQSQLHAPAAQLRTILEKSICSTR